MLTNKRKAALIEIAAARCQDDSSVKNFASLVGFDSINDIKEPEIGIELNEDGDIVFELCYNYDLVKTLTETVNSSYENIKHLFTADELSQIDEIDESSVYDDEFISRINDIFIL